ncbi:LysR family transcriptional regulator [Marinomonas transparens]|uniref:LysR family transcriptional regulator n=1 Tax=Marinomonas transparens TaxID=2795388 RepID=A0A934JS23_9GAMM|nr:LysR family transcriptional regulator [Marinomonas transparens]MBJ7538979.1 LysR family transcriptional regulator [Marinomonas transparens]
MHLDEILKLDIKLLVAFVTIMEEGSVSRAAERLGVTQPALSKSLQRLRELFKDSLFTRQAYGLSPTARATELQDMIQPILHSLSTLMIPSELNLKTLKRRFKIRVNEADLETFIEPLLAELHYQTPGVRLSISNCEENIFDELLAGNTDLTIMHMADTPGNIRSKLIGYMSSCVIISEANPLFNKEEVSLDDLLKYNTVTHHLPSHSSSAFVATVSKLKQQGYAVEPTLETDSLMVAMQAVKRGMSFFAPRSIGELFLEITRNKNNFYPVRVLPMPKELLKADTNGGDRPVQICWHERSNNDPSHRWLREKIIHFMRESPWIKATI